MVTVRHNKVAAGTNSATAGEVSSNAWNEDHVITGLGTMAEASTADYISKAEGVADTGASLIKYKANYANTYARTLEQLKDLGADEKGGVSIMHWIDPARDADLLAGTNTTDLKPYIVNALAALSAAAIKPVLTFPSGMTFYISSGLDINVANLTIDLTGATIKADHTTSAASVIVSASGVEIINGAFLLAGGAASPWHLNVTGTNCKLNGTKLEKNPSAGGYQMYVREGATGFRMYKGSTSGSNGIYLGASDAVFDGNSFVGYSGGDDCLAIKAINGPVTNIQFTNNFVQNLTAICSIGSEIGTAGANDATYSRYVSNVKIDGNLGVNLGYMAFIKPGANASNDYRDGKVFGVDISNNTLLDLGGTKFQTGLMIWASRGAKVYGITGKNNVIIARAAIAPGGATRTVGGHLLYISDNGAPGVVGTAQAEIKDIDVGIKYIDPYFGVVNGASAPGHPVWHSVYAEVQTAGRGVFSAPIRIGIDADGCYYSGTSLASTMPDNVLDFTRLRIVNANNNGSSVNAALDLNQAVFVSDPNPELSVVAAGSLIKTTGTGAVSGGLVPTGRLKGRSTAGNGELEDLTAAQAKTLLAIAAADVSGLGYFATGTDAANLTGTLATARLPALTGGDVTSSAGSGNLSIANDSVTYPKIQNVSATSRILGRKTAGAGDIEELTLSELLDFIGSSVQGDILIRGAAGWERLAAGTAGYLLKTGGAGANPSWDETWVYKKLTADYTQATTSFTTITDGTTSLTYTPPANTDWELEAHLHVWSTDTTNLPRVGVNVVADANNGYGGIQILQASSASSSIVTANAAWNNSGTNAQMAAGGLNAASLPYPCRIWVAGRSGSVPTAVSLQMACETAAANTCYIKRGSFMRTRTVP